MPTQRHDFIEGEKTIRGRHLAYSQKINGEYFFRSPETGDGFDAYKAATRELKAIIGQCVRDDAFLRARGSLWSLSTAAVTDDRLLATSALRGILKPPLRAFEPTYRGARSRVRLVECGCRLSALNNALFNMRLSIPTSGSNDGQTLAGAMSTGTHGAAFNVGAVQDFVIGLHIVVSPTRSVYLERDSYPVMRRGFARMLDADLKRDDDLFNAALVSFGSFGIIQGILIEPKPLFLLHAVRFFHGFDPALEHAIQTLDFSRLRLPSSASSIPKDKPHHFEIVINPNQEPPLGEVAVVLMYEDDLDPSTYVVPDFEVDDFGPGVDGLSIMGALTELIPHPLDSLLKDVLNAQVRDRIGPFHRSAAIRDMFRGEPVEGRTLAAAMAIPRSEAIRALGVVMRQYEQFGRVLPALIDMRFVKGTQATLGFTRFPETCVLEFDSINTRSCRQFLTRVWSALEREEVPFTLHWGKFNSFLTNTRLRRMYTEEAVESWLDAREELLNPGMREIFSNKFIADLGLHA